MPGIWFFWRRFPRRAAWARSVAFKALVLEGRDEEAGLRFSQEAKLAARVVHPNVVAVYGSGVDEGLPYIVYECVDGQSLDVLLGKQAD